MSMPRYPVYRPSGADWPRELPEDWQLKPLKHALRLVTRRAEGSEFPVALENIDGWTGRFIQTEGEFANDGIAFEPGDILLGKLRPYLAKVYLAKSRGEAVGDLYVLRPSEVLGPAFAQYYMLTREFISIIDSSTVGAKMPRVSWEFLRGVWIPLPPPSSQRLICEFLDREVAKIDALIIEQERLIELLKEKRQAVISQAVTKGLNPDAPMKPSGVGWLGEIPGGWEIRRLKHISPSLTVGIVVNPSEYVSPEGLPYIYGADIREGVISWERSRRIDPAVSDAQAKTRLRAGDLLTVRVGAPGVTAVVPPECHGGNCASVMLIRSGGFDSRWLCYAMNARIVRYQVEVVQYGAAQEQFNISHAVNFLVPVPPAETQAQIADYLDKTTKRIDDLVESANACVDLYRERRSALISATVTGQIDVRALAEQKAA